MKKRWFMVALSMIVCSMFLLSGCKIGKSREIVEDIYFYYDISRGEGVAHLAGLTELGKQQKNLVVPKLIGDGRKVISLSSGGTLLEPIGELDSAVLEALYVIPSVEIALVNTFYACRALRKIIFINTDGWTKFDADNEHKDYNKMNNFPMIFISSFHYDAKRYDGKNKFKTYYGFDFYFSNCNYFYNYDGAENDGYYWSDNYDYGEKITYVPQNPEREGYIFGGWFKEPECVNVWNFDTDTLPEAKYNEEGEALYQETRLYAKWYAQSDQG